jgi:hypothetical protein
MHSRQGVVVSAPFKNNAASTSSPVLCPTEQLAALLRANLGSGYAPAAILAGHRLVARAIVLEFPMQGNGLLDDEEVR